ncbi:Cdc37 N terminal kinase binding-domain-containing protein [Lactarius akahatsu]|uniref:Hsp90 chaperone protein kinase-targeting subunit n=1 Tax=Lactarius akahatsu TaxID=416441 RepID=A0AAD4LGK5_9AGAM|nr:Cdc37 N terminal kinase binding-domain-containing protein [Lactarius akahatsu]
MPLNYSKKWDKIEISDSSDIETHLNVDTKSLILTIDVPISSCRRFYQREIRNKRKARNHRIEQLRAEIACNDILLVRLRALQPKLAQSGSSCVLSEIDRLPPPSDAAKPVPYDETILTLLQAIAKESQENTGSDTSKLDKLLEERLDFHTDKLSGITEERRKERDALLKEKFEHITMDDLHVGLESKVNNLSSFWETLSTLSKYVPSKPDPAPVTYKAKSKGTSKTTRDDDGPVLPQMTPSLEEFARLPLLDFEKLWLFIQSHREVVATGASEALFLAAFRAQRSEYSAKLGKDDLRKFFNGMAAGGENARASFRKDRAEQEAQARGEKLIQLVAGDPGTGVSFNVPDGPPSEHLVLERSGIEGMDIEEALQIRWDIFCGLPEDLQEALKAKDLAAVNKVFKNMPVSIAENVVNALDRGGILIFSEEGIRDDTGRIVWEDDDTNETEDTP